LIVVIKTGLEECKSEWNILRELDSQYSILKFGAIDWKTTVFEKKKSYSYPLE